MFKAIRDTCCMYYIHISIIIVFIWVIYGLYELIKKNIQWAKKLSGDK